MTVALQFQRSSLVAMALQLLIAISKFHAVKHFLLANLREMQLLCCTNMWAGCSMPHFVTLQARPSSAADTAAMSSAGASQEGTDAANRSASQAANATAKLQYTVAQRMKEAGEAILLS